MYVSTLVQLAAGVVLLVLLARALPAPEPLQPKLTTQKSDQEKPSYRDKLGPTPLTPTVVRTIPITTPLSQGTLSPDATAIVVPPPAAPIEPSRPAARPAVRPTSTPDICARHNMRKVHYGKRWRCVKRS